MRIDYQAAWPWPTRRLRRAVGLAEMKRQLRIAHDEFDTEIDELIDAATEYTEELTGRFLPLTVVKWEGPFWPRRLLRPPFFQWLSARYWDENGQRAALAASEMVIGNDGDRPARLWPGTADEWFPTLAQVPDALTLRWIAGYRQVPAYIRQAIKLLVNHWFEHREAVGQITAHVQLSYTALVDAAGWGYLPQQWEMHCRQRQPVVATVNRDANLVNVLGEDLNDTEIHELASELHG